MTEYAKLPLITATEVRLLTGADAMRDAVLVASADGWRLHLNNGTAHALLRKRDAPQARVFHTLDGAGRFARSLGCARVSVDLTRFPPAGAGRQQLRRAGSHARA